MAKNYNPVDYIYRIDSIPIEGDVMKVKFSMTCVMEITIRKYYKNETISYESVDECFIHHASKKCTRVKPGTETTQNLGFVYLSDICAPSKESTSKITVSRLERIKLVLPDGNKLILTKEDAKQLATDIMTILEGD